MSNDPDLIEQPCGTCGGECGGFIDISDEDLGYVGEVYVECTACDGAGVR